MPVTLQMLQRASRLELTTRRLVDGLVSGAYNSVFHGRGIEFNEIREYHYGDDVRAIDWNVTARLDRPYIKEFIEERDLQVYVIVDVSGSGSFGKIAPKQDRINEIAASLILAAQRSGDRAGMFIVTDRIEEFVPARRGRRHAMHILHRLVSCEPDSVMTDLGSCLEKITKIVKRRSLIVLVSDLIDESDFERPLRYLVQHNDVIIIRVNDSRERQIPNVGMIQLEDAETGDQILVDTSDESFRRTYAEIIAHAESKTSSLLARCHVDSIRIDSDTNYESSLLHFFKTRNRIGRIHGRL